MSPRVLLAHPSPDLYGSDRVLLESITGLVAAGADVTVTLPESGPLVPLIRAAGAGVTIIPVPVLRRALLQPQNLARAGLAAPAALRRTVSALRALAPDVVVVNTVTIPIWLAAARLSRIPTVAHVHEADRAQRSLVRRVLTLPLRAAHRVIANSAHTRDTILDSVPALARRTSVLYNGVPGPRAALPRGARPAQPVLVCVGRLSERKGAAVAIEAIAVLRERGIIARLDLVGSSYRGAEAHEEVLRARIVELALTTQVRFRGFRDPVWPELARADIAIIPSLGEESFGNTAVEAVMAERPAIASDAAGLREAGGGFATVELVEPGSAEAIADAVMRLLARWDELDTAAAAADAHRRFGAERYRTAFAAAVYAAAPGAVPAAPATPSTGHHRAPATLPRTRRPETPAP